MDWIPFELGRPLWLLPVAAAIVGTFWIARHSLAGQSAIRQRISLTLRVLLLVLVGLALADLRFALRGRGVAVLFLLDLSDSIPRDVTERVLQDLARLTSSLDSDERAGLIVFGRDASVEREPSKQLGSPQIQSIIDRDGTDIGAALRLADATFASANSEGGRRVVVISDGNANRGDALLEARNLAVSGAVVDVLAVDYSYEVEAMVDSVLVPPEVHPEEPYVVEAILQSEVTTQSRVQLYENGQLVEAREVELLPGKTRVQFRRTNEEKVRYSYEVRIFPEDDTVTKNNVGYGFTLIRGDARVLVVCDPDEQAPLLDSLRSSRITCEVVTPEAIPGRPDDYFIYDAIVLANIPAYELGTERMKLLHGVVKNLGIGFVMVGGPDSFGAGGYRGTPIEQLLPVEMEVKKRKMIPNGALVMILHTCEFPQGNMWAKRIANIAIEALSPEDYVGVLIWGGLGGDQWGVPFAPARDKAYIANQINMLQPADMPSFAPSMRLAAQALAPANAVQKHLLIISDGDPQLPTRSTMESLISNKISVSCVCISPHGGTDTGPMKKIAKDTGGRYYRVDDPTQLPQIFFREALQVRRNLITEERFVPRVTIQSEVLNGVVEEGIPELGGYVITTPKALAETSLVSHQEDPILSQWRYGLAKTAAFTSDATGRWAQDWLGWPGYDTFWAQLVRSVSRRGAGELFRVERIVDGDRGRIVLDAIDPDGRYIDDLSVEGQVLDPKFEEQQTRFQQTGPGRYEAEFNARRSGTYLLSLNYEDASGARGSTQTGLNVSYSPEYRELKADPGQLSALAEATGGRVLGPDDDPFSREGLPPRYQRRSLWEELLQLALVVFFLDVFFRRVLITLAPLKKLVALLRGRRTRPAQPSSEVLGALLERKDQVRSTTTTPERKLEINVSEGQSSTPTSGTPAGSEALQAAPKEAPPAPAQAESSMDRLLRAKRQARDERDSKE